MIALRLIFVDCHIHNFLGSAVQKKDCTDLLFLILSHRFKEISFKIIPNLQRLAQKMNLIIQTY